MKKGIVFNIQRYSVHDGPGIRTVVFLKGCPLRCRWCSNPESWKAKPELGFNSTVCIKCKNCFDICPRGAISFNEEWPVFDRLICDGCGKCQEVCAGDAIKVFGKEMTVDDVLSIVEKDIVFYNRSQGGMTLSGGEPVFQWEFSAALLDEAKKRNIHTTVETTAFGEWNKVNEVVSRADLIFCDFKHIQTNKHYEYTGVHNKIILENIYRMSSMGLPLVLRVPLIPGFNDDEQSLREMRDFIISLPNVKRLGLLPYHEYGKNKYEIIGKKYDYNVSGLSQKQIDNAKEILEETGLQVQIGS